ncbi:hypothetical protein CB1_000223012 [Camelus ferus]|nr:hypothetical protein CB1_000223012 [Camelus ferus]
MPQTGAKKPSGAFVQLLPSGPRALLPADSVILSIRYLIATGSSGPGDISQLVQEGRFLEACETISRSAVEKQDCGSQYQAVAQGMWQVVQEALSGSERSRQLQPKLQSVMAAVNWAENFEGPKPSTLQGGGLAAWDSQLQSLLRKDAEARLPGPVSGAELSGYLEELGKAVEHVLGPQLEGRLGVCFLALYRVCFQEVLCSHLSVLLSSSGEDRKNYYKLYTWGRATLFGHREMRQKAPPASKEPTAARRLLDPVMFVTWMFQVQEKLLELIQLLNETIVVGRDIGPPISSRVRIMVVGTFLEFLNRYQEEGAPSFIQLHASAGTFPQLHVLENCCILRKTWEALVQEGPVQGIINSIEVWSQDDLLSRVRALFQSLLEHHFSTRNDDLVQALQSLQQALKGCSNMHSTPTYKVLVKSLYMVVLGEYVHALVTYLKTLEPGVWADREGQVKKEVLELDTIFGEREGRALAREWRCPFLEVTAKSKLMVDQVFTQVVREMEALAPPEEEVPAIPTNAQDTWPSERFIG